MAEGDASQNQGNQQPVDQPKEVKNEPVDQQKLDRAAKERERRRRRRRKKSELRRLERENLANPQSVQPNLSGQSKPLPDQKSAERPFLPEQPKQPQQPVKPPVVPKFSEQSEKVRKPRKRRPGTEKPLLPKAKVEPPRLQEHPLEHKTHDFAGPLIGHEEQSGEPPLQEPEELLQPEPKSIQDEPQVSQPPEHEFTELEPLEPEPPKPEPHEPELTNQEPEEPELVEPLPPEPSSVEPEPSQTQAAAPVPAPHELLESEQSQVHGGVPSEPEHMEEPLKVEQPEEIQPDNDIIFHDRDQEPQHRVEIGQIYENEQPEPPHQPESEEAEEEAQPVEEVHELEPPKEKKLAQNEENKESSKEDLPESEGLSHRKSFLASAGSFSASVFKRLGESWHNFRLKFRFRNLLLFIVVILIGGALYAAYIFKVPQNIYNYFSGLFKTPVQIQVQVHVDNQLLNEWGINTSLLFGSNLGSVHDILPSQIFNSYYFGYLTEPKAQGETGITPAYYYGTGADVVAQTNEFIGYVTNLRSLSDAYSVDVYKMLDQSTNREKTLDDYITNLQQILTTSNTMSKQMNLEIDDLTVSYNSLSPDHDQFQTDFFAALQNLAGQKADFLLKSYVDVSQKQVALKAEIDALQKLSAYYVSAIQQLTTRLTAVQQNHAVLVQGIHVVNVPGANLNIILPPQ